MKKFLFILLTAFLSQSIVAQINRGGEPYAFRHNLRSPQNIVMPTVDEQAYLIEDMQNTDTKKPFRFGIEIDTSLSISNCGTWETVADGGRIWQLQISSEDAKSLNFIFDHFYVPQGGKVFIYTPDHSYVTGAFTEQSNNPERVFSTSLYPGSSVIIECYEPQSAYGQTELSISMVVHGYREFFFKTDKGNYGTSGSCNININCTEGDDWQIEKRGVALILRGGSAHCTGTLINNTSNDGTPYFLTANHCVSSYSPSTFVFVFKHEAATCSGTTGPTIYSVNYATLIASGSNSDFALLQLNDSVPTSYDPYYVGWSRSTTAATAVTGIHHPSGDVKKISHSGAVTSSSYNTTSDDGTHWKVGSWTQGTTEGGSSGSALFDQNHRIIGQLHGGSASCSNTSGSDYYGKFAYSWNNNNATSSSARLKDWLDPNNTNDTICPAFDPCVSSLTNDVLILNNGIDSSYCHETTLIPTIRITNRGNDTLTSVIIKYKLDNQSVVSYNWAGSLTLNSSVAVSLSQINASFGNHTLTIWCENPNGTTDQNLSNDTIVLPINFINGQEISYRIKVDDQYAGYVSYFGSYLSWSFKKDDGTVLATHSALETGDFTESFCTSAGCYVLQLNYNQYISRLKSYFTIEAYVNGQIVSSGSGLDSLQFCTSDVAIAEAQSNDFDFAIYPNPANKDKVVKLSANSQPQQYQILDISGRVCISGNFEDKDATVSLVGLNKGVYLIRVIGNEGTAVRKFVIQ